MSVRVKCLILQVRDQLSQRRTNGRWSLVGSHGKKLFSRDTPGPSIVLLWVMSHDPAIFGAPVAMNQPWSAGETPVSLFRTPITFRTDQAYLWTLSLLPATPTIPCITVLVVENKAKKWQPKMLVYKNLKNDFVFDSYLICAWILSFNWNKGSNTF